MIKRDKVQFSLLLIVVSSIEVNRRRRRREVKEIIRKEVRINGLVMRIGLIIIGNTRLRFAIDNISRIIIEKKE